ncbi:MAG: MinD/ParA family protein [Ectothiorhodospiraceae bacterium]
MGSQYGDPQGRSATTIAVTSGKGGVGKTSLATNVAMALSGRGHRVCLLDADIGLANVNILLGIQPSATVEDVLAGRAELESVVTEGPEGLSIIPAASGLERLASSPNAGGALVDQLRRLEQAYDYLLVDTPAGMGPATRSFVRACSNTLLTITPEPTSLTDAFTLLKALQREGYEGRLSVVVNMLPQNQDGSRLFERFRTATLRHLGIELDYLGEVPMDRAVTGAVLNQRPLLVSAPQSPAARQIVAIAERIPERFPPHRGNLEFSSFWDTAPLPTDSSLPVTEEPESEKSEVVTPPEEMRAVDGAESRDTSELTRIGERIEKLLLDNGADESDVRRFFARVERAFTSRYQRRANDIKSLIYEALLHDQLSEAQHREILDALHASFTQRYTTGQPVGGGARQIDTDALSDGDLYALLQRLRPTVSGEPGLAREVLSDWITDAVAAPDWPEAASRHLAEALEAAHQARFERPLFHRDAALRENLAELRGTLRNKRHALERALTEVCVLLDEHAEVERRLQALEREDDAVSTGGDD